MARNRIRPEDTALRHALLRWFQRMARPLPWRNAASPYAIWVSEIMLQQTQVATVVPYYRRFLRAFPNLPRLAAAPLEKVLELWAGMGYYRRARHLHQAARVMVKKFGGEFPGDYRQARSLPGVGDYTARAVLSLAYNQPYAVLDGNVARVVARLEARRGRLHQRAFRAAAEAKLARLLARRRPGDFNQALMELGQTVCLPRAPRCGVCPLKTWCRAYRQGRPEAYPQPRPRRATERRFLAAAVIRRHGRIALVRGLDGGLLDDLWNFPAAFGSSRREALNRLRKMLSGTLGAGPLINGRLGEVRHGITYRAIHADIYSVALGSGAPPDSFRWMTPSSLPRAAVSQLARKIAARLT